MNLLTLLIIFFSSSVFSKELRRDRIPTELNQLVNCLPSDKYTNTPFNKLFNGLTNKQLFFFIKFEFYKHIFNSHFLPFTYQRDFKFTFNQNKRFLIKNTDEISKLCDLENFMFELIVKNKEYSINEKYLYTWSNYLRLKIASDEDIPKPSYKNLFDNMMKKLRIITEITLEPELRTNYVFLNKNKFETSNKNTIQENEVDLSKELDKIFNSLDR